MNSASIFSTCQQNGQNGVEIWLFSATAELLHCLSPKKIAAAIQSATKEDDRSKELVMFGVPEEQEEYTSSKVTKVLEGLDKNCKLSDQQVLKYRTKN